MMALSREAFSWLDALAEARDNSMTSLSRDFSPYNLLFYNCSAYRYYYA